MPASAKTDSQIYERDFYKVAALILTNRTLPSAEFVVAPAFLLRILNPNEGYKGAQRATPNIEIQTTTSCKNYSL